MDLALAASYFDDIVASDAYDPAKTFLCQVDPLNLFKVDATAVRRREVMCGPSVAIPARKAIAIGGEIFLVGDASPDYFQGECVRKNYVVQGAEHLASFTSIAGELAGTPGVDAYVSVDFNKFMTDQRFDSEYQAQYEIFASGSETKPELIKIGLDFYLVKGERKSSSGFLTLASNLLPAPVFETITAKSRTYNPATDTWSEITSSLKIFRVRYTEDFKYLTDASLKYERGDSTVHVLKSALTPKSGDKMALSDGTHNVLSILDSDLTWQCHVRHQ